MVSFRESPMEKLINYAASRRGPRPASNRQGAYFM
jgi:hypothetical protein